ncbi:AraC family transcriptional regulator [Saccharomonospora sp. NPDC006951]
MRAAPLHRYELFHTSDIDHARELASRVFCEHQLVPHSRISQLDARLRSTKLDRTAVSYLAYGADVRISPGARDYYAVLLPLRGECRMSLGSRRIVADTSTAVIVSPEERLLMHWQDRCQQLILRIDRDTINAHLQEVTGANPDTPIAFAPVMPVTFGLKHSWRMALLNLVADLDQEHSLSGSALAARAYERALLSGLLLAQSHNYENQLSHEGGTTHPRAVRMAIEIMRSQPAEEHTSTSLARKAGVDTRTLQRAFRRSMDTTPMTYLRQLRLQRARDELSTYDIEQTSVSRVAARWGFPHAGRFSVMYREQFGEPPSRTLHR